MMYCLVIASSYSGNLKAFLTTPKYTKSLRSLEEIVNSGLRWEMVDYANEDAAIMSTSTDPVIRTIWDDKVEIGYAPTPDVSQAICFPE